MTFRPDRRDSVVALAGVLAGAAVATAIAVAVWAASADSSQAQNTPRFL